MKLFDEDVFALEDGEQLCHNCQSANCGRPCSSSEEESINLSIAELDCPEGAAALVKWKADFLKILKGPFETHGERIQLERELGHIYYGGTQILVPQSRNYIIIALARHPDPALRIFAIRHIGHRPIPQHVLLLKDLINDEVEEVRSLAVQTQKELDAIRDGR